MVLEDLTAQLEADLDRLINHEGVPGASVALAVGPDVAEVTSGVVNTRTGVPVTPDSLFQIQSITKIFTATLVMQLVDDGLVELDAPIQTYLPEFHTVDRAASRDITVRHLLTHTGGFEGDLWQPTTSGPDALDRFVRDLVSRAPQHSTPGQRFSYCNAGFGTLGRLVEVLRGHTFEQVLRTHLAEPLGIDELAFSADQALAFRTAIGHVRPTPSAAQRPTREWAVVPPSNPAAGNQLALSARGLLRLGQVFVTDGPAPRGVRVLSQTSTALMLQPQLQHRDAVPSPVLQGLGWRLPRPGIAEHGGGMPGVAALLVVAPEHGLTAVVLTNADAGGQLARRLLDPLLTNLTDIPPARPLATPDARLRVADPTPFLGRYTTRQQLLDVTADSEGRLWLTDEPRGDSLPIARRAGMDTVVERHELRPLGEDVFAVIGNDGRATRTISFLDPRPDGRLHFLATDEVAPRDA